MGQKLQVGNARRYTGLDGYKQLLESNVDAVAIESPPYFHPEQVVNALSANKHVYLAKPVAVDVPGCNAITQAAARVKDKLSVLVDFQTRVDEFYQGAYQRIVDGMIGNSVCGQAYYHDSRLGVQAEPGTPMARLRNWVFDIALSGDIIVEQNIHVLDVANWFLRGHPTEAVGTAGRKVRTDVGDCNDHYVVTYTYPGDVVLDFSSSQFLYGFSDLCCRIYGSLGTADTHYGGPVQIRAKTGGYNPGATKTIYRSGALTNIKNFCEAIAAGKTLNNADESANSTLTSILGRIAALEQLPVTWDEMMKANAKLDAKLDLPDDGPNWRGA
jgi:predicted dehydrogenase